MNTQKILGFSVGPIATAALGLITVPLVAWVFTPEDVGRLYILQVVISFSVLLFTLGLDQAYVREFYESPSQAVLLKNTFLPGVIFLAIAAVPAAALAEKLSYWLFGVASPFYFWATLGCVMAAFISRFLSLILRMQERAMAFSMSQVIPKAIFVVLIALIVLAGFPTHFLQLQFTLLVSTVAVLLIYAWNTHRQWIPALRASVDIKQLRFMLGYSVPLIFAGLAYWGLSATSALALRTLSSFRELGIYSVAMSVAGVAIIFQSIFSVIWAPVVYKWAANGTDMSRVDRVARQALAVVCGIFVLCGIFSWLADYVLPSQYAAVKYLVMCSIAQPLLYTLSEVTGVGIGITRRTMLSLWSTVAALLANLVLNILLVPSLGASGAVIANALAYLVFFLARTESSAYVWRRLPWVRLYSFVIIAISLSVLTVTFGPTTGNLYSVIWLAALFPVLWAFRNEVRTVIHLFQIKRRLQRERRRSKGSRED